MAKKIKKTASKPKKKRSSGKRKSNSLINRVIVIIFVLILAFFLVFSLYKHVGNRKVSDKPEPQLVEKQVKQKEVKSEAKTEAKTNVKASEPTAKEEKKIQQKKSETAAVQKSIQGTWQSTTGGAFLTMDKNGYRLDFMGVDGDAPIIGTYTVDGDIITFINKEDPCKNVKGLYEVKFNKNEIGFKLKSDDCTKRKATLPTEWEWLNTEE